MRLPSGEICTSSAYSSWKTSMECRRLDSGSSAATAVQETDARAAPSTARDTRFIGNPRVKPGCTVPDDGTLQLSLICEFAAQRNLRVQHLGHRAAGLGLFGDFHEGLVV